MTSRLVNARDDFAAFGSAECRLNLVSVMIGIIHADYFFNLAEFFQQDFAPCLFPAKLAVIGHVLKLTSAAFFGKRAGVGIGFKI